jgi:hypothetical protein
MAAKQRTKEDAEHASEMKQRKEEHKQALQATTTKLDPAVKIKEGAVSTLQAEIAQMQRTTKTKESEHESAVEQSQEQAYVEERRAAEEIHAAEVVAAVEAKDRQATLTLGGALKANELEYEVKTAAMQETQSDSGSAAPPPKNPRTRPSARAPCARGVHAVFFGAR